jgi:hypothetical protein
VKTPARFGPRRIAVIIALSVLLVILAVLAASWGAPGMAVVAVLAALGGLVVVLGPRGFAMIRPSAPPPRT